MTISAVEDQRRETVGLRDAAASCCSSPLFTCPVKSVWTRKVEQDGDIETILCQMNRERTEKGRGRVQVKNHLQSSNILHSVGEMEGVPQADAGPQIPHLN